jgi:hypothetical protein
VTSAHASPGDTVLFAIFFSVGARPGHPLYVRIAFNGTPMVVYTMRIPAILMTKSDGPPSIIGGLRVPRDLPDGMLTVTAVLPNDGDSSSVHVAIRGGASRTAPPRPLASSTADQLVATTMSPGFRQRPRAIRYLYLRDLAFETAIDRSDRVRRR